MNSLLRALLVVLLTVMLSSVWAEEQCHSEGTQAQMNVCAFRDFKVTDQELNRVYQTLMDSLIPERQKKLREEQRAWLKERDPKCQKDANDVAEGGSMWPMIFNGCLEELTKIRIEQLRQWKW